MNKRSMIKKIRENMNIKGAKKVIHRILNPVISVSKTYMIRNKAKNTRMHYEEVIKKINASGRSKLNFAAYVIFDSSYGMDGVFKLMMKDHERWNPKIVVIPDVARGSEHAVRTYKKTKEYFINRYGYEYVFDGWNADKNEYYDYLDEFDIVYYANPYDAMVHDFHKISYSYKKDVLPIYVSYGYDVGRYTTLSRLRGIELNLVWKLFADTTYTYKDYLKYQIIKGKNVVLAGYSKMDDLNKEGNVDRRNGNRKRILIASHHTVSMEALPLSNFMKYYNLILELPVIFPDIDFVFRPHPLLFTTLVNNNIWTQEEIEHYIQALEERGVEYSTGGDYLGVFRECDAIINDCGSFTVEWLYTGKPGCFVYNDKLKKNHLTTLMNMAIEKYTIARSEQDIIEFVKKIEKNDYVKEYRMSQWVKENIALNHPMVSEFIINEIDILRGGNQ